MKIAVIIVRVLLGLLFAFSAVAYFFQLVPQPELTGPLNTFNEGMEASGYLMPVVKTIELVCGLALIVGRFVPLSLVLLAPIVVNIVGVHLYLAPEGLPVAVFVLVATIFLAVAHKSHFAPCSRVNTKR